MNRTVTETYEIHHTGEEADRYEILQLIGRLSDLCQTVASVSAESEKRDLITVTIETD